MFFAEVGSAIAIPSGWYESIVSVATTNAPILLTGFVAIMALSAGFYWIMKNARKAVKG